MLIHSPKFMKLNNLGNIKLVSLLFILGASSALLLIPAVIQKESITEQKNVKGNTSEYLQNNPDSLTIVYDNLKRDYIETPMQKINDTKNQISEIIENPTKALASEFENFSESKNLIIIQNTEPTSKEPLVRITKEMVENCKIITDEYNKNKN
jgi:hypothetical protein